jgi:hypothetical protein
LVGVVEVTCYCVEWVSQRGRENDGWGTCSVDRVIIIAIIVVTYVIEVIEF